MLIIPLSPKIYLSLFITAQIKFIASQHHYIAPVKNLYYNA